MTYDPAPAGVQSEAPQRFTNVFVNPSSYRSFTQTGAWPDKTTFILEARNSSGEASINKAGRFQTDLVGLEAEVKDSRFPDGWAYFNFGSEDVAPPLTGEVEASCITCHTEHTAGGANVRSVLSNPSRGGAGEGHLEARFLEPVL